MHFAKFGQKHHIRATRPLLTGLDSGCVTEFTLAHLITLQNLTTKSQVNSLSCHIFFDSCQCPMALENNELSVRLAGHN